MISNVFGMDEGGGILLRAQEPAYVLSPYLSIWLPHELGKRIAMQCDIQPAYSSIPPPTVG